jgi:hypothetical protein
LRPFFCLKLRTAPHFIAFICIGGGNIAQRASTQAISALSLPCGHYTGRHER